MTHKLPCLGSPVLEKNYRATRQIVIMLVYLATCVPIYLHLHHGKREVLVLALLFASVFSSSSSLNLDRDYLEQIFPWIDNIANWWDAGGYIKEPHIDTHGCMGHKFQWRKIL